MKNKSLSLWKIPLRIPSKINSKGKSDPKEIQIGTKVEREDIINLNIERGI